MLCFWVSCRHIFSLCGKVNAGFDGSRLLLLLLSSFQLLTLKATSLTIFSIDEQQHSLNLKQVPNGIRLIDGRQIYQQLLAVLTKSYSLFGDSILLNASCYDCPQSIICLWTIYSFDLYSFPSHPSNLEWHSRIKTYR